MCCIFVFPVPATGSNPSAHQKIKAALVLTLQLFVHYPNQSSLGKEYIYLTHDGDQASDV